MKIHPSKTEGFFIFIVSRNKHCIRPKLLPVRYLTFYFAPLTRSGTSLAYPSLNNISWKRIKRELVTGSSCTLLYLSFISAH